MKEVGKKVSELILSSHFVIYLGKFHSYSVYYQIFIKKIIVVVSVYKHSLNRQKSQIGNRIRGTIGYTNTAHLIASTFMSEIRSPQNELNCSFGK